MSNDQFERLIRQLRRKCSEVLDVFSEIEDEGLCAGEITIPNEVAIDMRVEADKMLDIALTIRRIERALKS